MAHKMYTVAAPDRRREQSVPYHKHFGDVLERLYGHRPSRTTLTHYLNEGYPIARCGPKVKVPVYAGFRRPMTTVEAADRFVTLVRALERGEAPPAAAPRSRTTSRARTRRQPALAGA